MLTKDRNVPRYVDQQLRTLSVKAATVIYRGAFVGIEEATGLARPLVKDDLFCGIAYEHCDNSCGGNEDREVTLFTIGDFEFSMDGADKTWIGWPVGADDDENLTCLGYSYIGRIIDVPVPGKVIVRLSTFGA